MEALPAKNTFIHFDEPHTPVAPPTHSAPDKLLDKSFRLLSKRLSEMDRGAEEGELAAVPEQPVKSGRRWNVLARMFGAGKAESAKARAPERTGSPMQVEQASMFATQRAGSGTLPAAAQPLSSPSVSEEGRARYVISLASAVEDGAQGGSTPSSDASLATAGSDVVAPPPPLPCRAGAPSAGSQGHCSGQCIPCLIQVRWQAGKYEQQCKFGEQCGRCHEAHTEQELQAIQAKMRKLKKKHGAKAAALLSSAFASGSVAPVGAGASTVLV